MDYTNNERVKRVLYHISADEKIQPLQYYYIPYRTRKTLSTYFNSTTYHHITLPQDERTTTNNIFILQPTREQDTTDETIPLYKTTSI